MAEDSRENLQEVHLCATWRGRRLVDYATAGNLFTPENRLKVWLK